MPTSGERTATSSLLQSTIGSPPQRYNLRAKKDTINEEGALGVSPPTSHLEYWSLSPLPIQHTDRFLVRSPDPTRATPMASGANEVASIPFDATVVHDKGVRVS
jgi:hypothetical protein